MVVPLRGAYIDLVKGSTVECRVYQHGFWDGINHVERLVGIEVLSVSKSFTCAGSSIHVFRGYRSYPLSKDDDGSFCITI